MRLGHKITAVFVTVLVLVVALVTTFLLVYFADNLREGAYEQIRTGCENLSESFISTTTNYLDGYESITVKNSVSEHWFSRFADENSVLIQGEDVIYSGVSIFPPDYLEIEVTYEPDPKIPVAEHVILGRNVLIAGTFERIGETVYEIFVVQDITHMYTDFSNIVVVCVAGSGFLILIGAIFVILFMRRSTKPLVTLSSRATHIAKGRYDERIEVATKDEVGELARNFNIMAQAVGNRVHELTVANQRQKLFIGGVTHEFKTPLTTLLIHAQLLQNANLKEHERDRSLKHIESQVLWLERLVQNLLKLITLNKDIEFERVSVPELFNKVSEMMEVKIAEQGVSLMINCDDAVINANENLMLSLLCNLVDNAIKAFVGTEGERIIEMSCEAGVISVRDHGIGMDSSDIAEIFEPFYMVDKSRSKKLGGSGIGLALVKQIADAHNFQISVSSEKGAGTTVSLIITN